MGYIIGFFVIVILFMVVFHVSFGAAIAIFLLLVGICIFAIIVWASKSTKKKNEEAHQKNQQEEDAKKSNCQIPTNTPLALGNEETHCKVQEQIGPASDNPQKHINDAVQSTTPAPSTHLSVSSIEAVKTTLNAIPTLREFNSCVLIDTETTGFSRTDDRIIEVGIAAMTDWGITDTFNSLVNPERHIPQSASDVNGIFDADVADAPLFSDIAEDIHLRISEKVVAGYNVSFDLGFLGREMSRSGYSAKVYYLDVLSLARRAYPDLSDYKLETVAKHLDLISSDDSQRHRALDDALLTGKVLKCCVDKLLADHDEELRIAKERRKEAAKMRRQKYMYSPLLDKNFVFTGNFQIDREQLESMVGNVGALLRQEVNRNTDYLVVGDLSALPDWAVERKSGKADALIASGKKIQKIAEDEYLAMMGDALHALKEAQLDTENPNTGAQEPV